MTSSHSALPISIRGLEKRFGAVSVLKGIDLDVEAGEFLTLLGPSGSGKTTLLMILAGFSRANAGSIRVGGQEIIAVPPHKRDIGMVFQSYALFPHMDVFHNVAFPLKQRRVNSAETRKRVQEALELVQMGDFAARRIDQLSGGQRQRIALARALVFEPRIVLMDEPLSALDKTLREHMQIELRAIHKRLGTTTVYVTHDQREAITMSDRVAVMNQGRIEQLDRPDVLYSSPRTSFVAGFIGESTVLPVEMADGAPVYAGRPLRVASPPSGTGRHELVLRPERVRLATGAQAGDANLFEATMADAVYQGESFLCYATLEDGRQLVMRDYCRGDSLATLPRAGERVVFAVDPADTIIVAASS